MPLVLNIQKRYSTVAPLWSHLIDDLRNASIRSVNLIDCVDRCLGGMACSHHESNAIPNYLPSVIRILDLAPLRSCKQPTPSPKLVLMPNRMEITGRARQSGMPDFNLAASSLLLLLRFAARRAGWIAIRRIVLLSKCCCSSALSSWNSLRIAVC
jgi:hypothetical protein